MAARTTTAGRGAYRRPPTKSRSRRPPARSAPLRIRWERVGRVAMLIVLAVVLGLYVQQGLSLLSVRGQADQQAAIVKQLSHENAQLRRRASALNNPSMILREARALGMIKPGEQPYVVTGLPGG